MRRSTFHSVLLVLILMAPPGAYAFDEEIACAANQHELAFRTTQGTIANLDVSPDGTRVVFDLLGDLYVLPIKGGKTVALTRGMGWDVRPVWSPDGRQVAFISDRAGNDQIFVVDVVGRGDVRQISSGMELLTDSLEGVISAAEWTPDSKALVVHGTRLPVDGGISAGSRISNEYGAAYHGNGVALYQFRPLSNPASWASGDYAIWRAEADAKEWRDTGEILPRAIISPNEAPLVSRDGRWLVYKERAPVMEAQIAGAASTEGKAKVDIIRVRDHRTGALRTLLAPGLSPGWRDNGNGGAFAANGRYAITVDSQHLVAAYGGGLHKVNLNTGKNVQIPMSVDVAQCMDTMVQQDIRVDDSATLSVRNMRGTTIRQDGKQLAFSALRRLYVVDPRGGRPTLLAPQSEGQFQPSYSPDGKWIAYVSWSESRGGHVWRVPAIGGTPERLTSRIGYYQTPVWSPDGKKLVFIGSDDIAIKRPGYTVHVHGGKLHVLSLADRTIHQLPVLARLGHPPSFSEDGQRIWYVPYADISDVQVQVHSIGIDGGQPRDEKLTKLLPRGGAAAAVPSPNGRLIAVIKNGNLHLVQCGLPIGSKNFNIDTCVQTRITKAGAYDPRWRANGRELEWAFANSHYRISIKELIEWAVSGAHEESLAPIVKIVETHLDVPQRTHHGTAVLSGARIITMRGDEVIENGAVLVQEGRIVQVGRADDISIPEGATVIDLRGKTLLPGFIDAHAHLSDLPRDLLDANNADALIYLAYGITTAKDPSNGGDHAYTYTELIKAGDMVGPRLFGSEGLVSEYQTIDSFDDALGIAQRTQRLGGTYLKYHTGWNRAQRRWIMEAARQSGLGIAAHWAAQNYVPGRLNLSTILDGAATAEHSISEGRDTFSDAITFLAKSGVAINFAAISSGGYYPSRYWNTLKTDPRLGEFYVGEAPSERTLPAEDLDSNGLPALASFEESNAKLIAAIAHAGGITSVGSHGDFDGVGFHLEMWAYVRGGMTPHEVLRAATLNGARATGVANDLGSIAPGKVADLIVLGKNPLDDIRNTLSVERVMQGGVLRDAMTLDESWPMRDPLPAWKIESAQKAEQAAISIRKSE